MFGSITILDLWKNLSRDSKNNWLFLGFILFGILSFFSILVSAQCIGYVQGDVCYAIGDEVVENGVRYYADIGGVLTGKKIVGTSCNNDFECLNNLCSNGECVDLYGEVEGNRGVIEAIEDVEINNMEISLATLKDNYRIGEQIKLTDPPSDEIINNEPNQNNIDSLNDNRIINNGIENIIVHDSNSAYTKEYNNDIDDSLIGRSQIDSIENINGEIINQDEEFEGYIVEFEDDPIIVEKVNLEERAERNEEIIENNPILTTISGYRYFVLREEEVPQEIEEYREDLERDNERIKDRIANELSVELGSNNPFSDFFNKITGNAINDEELEVVNEFKTVFNGVVLDVSEEEVEKIEEVRGVKSVSPNYKVYATLQESVPLINADDVWLLDSEGDNCVESGEECLTGKGVSIGIIDTGVDYTHGDLGCEDEECFKFISPYTPREADLFGDKIVWLDSRTGQNQIYLYNLGNDEEYQITLRSGDKGYPAIYNNKIYWTSILNGSRDIFSCDIDTSMENLTRWCSSYSPEGGLSQITSFEDARGKWDLSVYNNKIVYSTQGRGSYLDIHLYDIETNEEKVISALDANQFKPDIYENYVIWADNRNYDQTGEDIYLFDLDTETEIPLYTGPGDQRYPKIDGNRIVWTDLRSGNQEVYMFDLETNVESKISEETDNGRYNPTIYNDIVLWEGNIGRTKNIFIYNTTSGDRRVVDANKTTLSVLGQDPPLVFGENIVFRDGDPLTRTHQFFNYNLLTSISKKISGFDISNNSGLFPNSKVVGGYDFINNDNDPMDDHGHGTHVAGTAAGNGVLKGVAPDAEIYAFKVLNSGGSGSFSGIIAAIERSVDLDQDGVPCENEGENGDVKDYLDVISLSLGGLGNPDDPQSRAIDAASECTVAVIAAGNSGPNPKTIRSPGTARKAITVAASDKGDNLASFSSRGLVEWTDASGDTKFLLKPDVTAPGVSICAAQWNNAWSDKECLDSEHTAISGTSMATPHVSGAAALLLQKNPEWTPEEVKMALRNTAVDIGEEINTQGYGRIDVESAINLENGQVIAEIMTGGGVSGEIDISGSAYGENFESYTLYFGVGENPSEWIEIENRSEAVENGILFEDFDTGLLDDGINSLRLVVRDSFGRESEDRNIVEIKNLIVILKRLGGIEENYIDIIGTASGNKFDNFTLYYGVGRGPSEWIEITSSDSPIDNGILYNNFDISTFTDINYIKLVVRSELMEIIESEKYFFKLDPNIRQITSHISSQNNPSIFGDKIVWEDYRNGYSDIYMCDNILNGQAGGCLSNDEKTRITDFNSGKYSLLISGDKIVWMDDRNGNPFGGNWDIYMYDIITGIEEKVTTVSANRYHPSISGDKIVWMDDRNGVGTNWDIYMYDITAGIESQITGDSSKQQDPSISGNNIVWVDDRNGNWDIYMCDNDLNGEDGGCLANDNKTRITDFNSFKFSSSISGNNIVWVDDRNGNYDIYMYDITNSEENQITNNLADQLEPLIHDNKIVWEDHTYLTNYFESNADIYLYDLFLDQVKRLTIDIENQRFPSIFGNKIVWEDYRNGNWDVYMYDIPSDSLTCGNNIREGTEECDGSNDLACPGLCNAECTCNIRTEPQSKVVNYNDLEIIGDLEINIQKNNGDNWTIVNEVINKRITVPANGLVKLDIGEDSNGELVFPGFNNLNVRVNEAGDYRTYARFELDNQIISDSWEFEVI